MRVDTKVSFALGAVMSLRFLNYAYCFCIGSFMKLGGVKSVYGKPLSGAEIYIVMTVILVAVQMLGVISFYGQMVMKAAGASTVIFDVITAPTTIDVNKDG
jgi:hypothetical protein